MSCHFKNFLIIVIMIFLAGCEDESSSGESSDYASIGQSFLTSTDISKPEGLEALTESEVLATLSNLQNVYANMPVSEDNTESSENTDDTEETEDNCWTDLIQKTAIVADGDTMSFGFQSSSGDCFKDMFPGSGEEGGTNISTLEVNLKIFYQIKCAGEDLSQYNGKLISELEETADDTPVECTTTEEILANNSFYLNMAGDISANGETLNVAFKSNSKNFQGTENLSACAKNKEGSTWIISDDCIYVDVSETESTFGTNSAISEKKYTRLNYAGLVAQDDKTSLWYNSGTLSAIVNDWTGTLTYSSADTAPSYELTDSSGATTSGTLSARTGLLGLVDFTDEFDQDIRRIKEVISSLRFK